VLEIQVKESVITGIVKGGEPYRQQIICGKMEESELGKVEEAFLNDPSLVIQVYFKKMTAETLEEPLRSLFFIPRFRFTCTCADEVSPCKHLVALAMAFSAEIEKDPAKYLLFCGVPWNKILQMIGTKEPFYEDYGHVSYSMVPLPPQVSYTPVSKKAKASPPFWVSPFPFPLIMEEIYTKVEEEADENEHGF